jgi:molybdenum cofactor guanylyltransferase
VMAAYATSCDVPLLAPSFVQAMIDRLGNADIAVPEEDGFPHPLAAVYRTTVLPQIHELLAADRLRPAFLFARATTNHIPVAELRTVDPALLTLRNVNHPDDYRTALMDAGFELDPTIEAALRRSDT